VLLALLLLFPVHASAQQQGAEMTAMSFFEATRAGNVGLIRAMVAGSLRDSVKVLLTENKKYPDFLRERYEDSAAEITSVSMLPDGDVLIDMAVTFPGDHVSLMRLRMSPHKGGGWRVVEQSQVY
jgi:hypothetical protein